MGKLRFRVPLKNANATVTSYYGDRDLNNDGKMEFHSGIDYRAREIGTPVLASEKGRVIRAALNEGKEGHLIIIDHMQERASGVVEDAPCVTAPITGHDDYLYSIMLSPDDKYLVVGIGGEIGGDGKDTIFDLYIYDLNLEE